MQLFLPILPLLGFFFVCMFYLYDTVFSLTMIQEYHYSYAELVLGVSKAGCEAASWEGEKELRFLLAFLPVPELTVCL